MCSAVNIPEYPGIKELQVSKVCNVRRPRIQVWGILTCRSEDDDIVLTTMLLEWHLCCSH